MRVSRAIFVLTVLSLSEARAATRTWSGATSASWSLPGNWQENATPVNADDLVFPAGAMNTTMQNDIVAATAWKSITFSAGGYTIQGNTVGITGSITSTNAAGVNTFQPALMLYTSMTVMVSSGGTLVFQGDVAMGSHPLNVQGNGNTVIAGIISGSAVLTKGGNGDLTLSGTNTYTGATVVNVGTLTITNGAALGSAAAGTTVNTGTSLQLSGGVACDEPITFSGTGLLNLGALRALAGGATLGGAMTLATGGASVGVVAGETLTIDGAIGGSTSLNKVGPGTLILAGTNTYAGSTFIQTGKLVVNGVQPQSPVSVTGSTILGGSGQTGAVTTTVATIAPGQSPGILSIGSLSFDFQSTFAVELNGTAPGTGYDRLAVTGTVSLANAHLVVTTGFAPTVGDSFMIIANDSNDAVSGTFAGLAEGATVSDGIYAYSITYVGGDGNDVVLTFMGCPSDVSGPTVTAPAAASVTQTFCN